MLLLDWQLMSDNLVQRFNRLDYLLMNIIRASSSTDLVRRGPSRPNTFVRIAKGSPIDNLLVIIYIICLIILNVGT